jgi:uncharacterized protein YkwD
LAAAFVVALVLLAASCSSERSPSSPSPAPSATFEQETHARINEYRRSRGLAALAWNDAVAAQARQHSHDMASGAVSFGHDGLDNRLAIIGRTIPWSSAAENVALNRTAAGAVDSWLDSPGHLKNIVGPYELTGVGAVAAGSSVYLTQIFVEPR